MGSPGVGIVLDEEVAGVDVPREALLQVRHRPDEGEDVDDVPLAQADELAAPVHQHAGEVLAFVQDRGIGDPGEVRLHLVNDGVQAFLDDFERDGVDGPPAAGGPGAAPFCLIRLLPEHSRL